MLEPLQDHDYSSEIRLGDGETIHLEALPKERNGWFFTSIQILNSMLGSGILAFPFTLARLGGVIFSLYLILFSFAVYFTSKMLFDAGVEARELNYTVLTRKVFGPVAAQLLNISICLTCFGALLSYLAVIGDQGSELAQQWGSKSNFLGTYPGAIVIVAIFVSPLIMFRSYGDLAVISLMSLAFIVFIVLFVLIKGRLVESKFEVAHTWAPSSWVAIEGSTSLFTFMML